MGLGVGTCVAKVVVGLGVGDLVGGGVGRAVLGFGVGKMQEPTVSGKQNPLGQSLLAMQAGCTRKLAAIITETTTASIRSTSLRTVQTKPASI
jgi:hypothetical protein